MSSVPEELVHLHQWLRTVLAAAAVATMFFCVWYKYRRSPIPTGKKSYKTMVVLGSGGHTSEMFRFLETLPLERKHAPRVYVIANSDTGSFSTMEEFEKPLESPNAKKAPKYEALYIPRSRVVGQSYFTSIFTTLYSFAFAAVTVWNTKPDLILANGPGTCLPLLVAAWIYRTLSLTQCAIILLESYACVKHESLTGKLCKRFVDRYCVQWPELLDPNSPHIVYTGRIRLADFSSRTSDPIDVIGKPSKSYVLVTVGSTLFEDLTQAIDTPEFVKLLKKNGFNGLHVQYGKGTCPSQIQSLPSFEVVRYDYKKEGWKEEMANASLVIGHAGAGTILDSLEARKPIIVVANDKLMSKHQSEISNVMERLGYIFSSSASKLLNDLPELLPQLSSLAVFPIKESFAFANELSGLLRANDEKSEKSETKSPKAKRIIKSPVSSRKSS